MVCDLEHINPQVFRNSLTESLSLPEFSDLTLITLEAGDLITPMLPVLEETTGSDADLLLLSGHALT